MSPCFEVWDWIIVITRKFSSSRVYSQPASLRICDNLLLTCFDGFLSIKTNTFISYWFSCANSWVSFEDACNFSHFCHREVQCFVYGRHEIVFTMVKLSDDSLKAIISLLKIRCGMYNRGDKLRKVNSIFLILFDQNCIFILKGENLWYFWVSFNNNLSFEFM
jgi:hypothetical protein